MSMNDTNKAETDQQQELLEEGWLKRMFSATYPDIFESTGAAAGNTATRTGSHTLGGISAANYPQTGPIKDSYPSRYKELLEQMQQKAVSEKAFAAMQAALAKAAQEQERARARLSKRELMRGVLEEMTQIRERLDQLTAMLATEAMTDDPTDVDQLTAATQSGFQAGLLRGMQP